MRPSETAVLQVALFPLKLAHLLGRYGRVRHWRAMGSRRVERRRFGIRTWGCDSNACAGVPRHPYGDEHGGYHGESHGASKSGVGNRAHFLFSLVSIELPVNAGEGSGQALAEPLSA
jgi:hypothetical protein